MFQSKRLCERWLDNLFMVLYEVCPLLYGVNEQDLRVYTLWRAEWEHFTKQQLKFHKQNNEWEMLGELALRLQHKVLPPSPSFYLRLPFPNLPSPNLYRQTCRLEFTMVLGIFA